MQVNNEYKVLFGDYLDGGEGLVVLSAAHSRDASRGSVTGKKLVNENSPPLNENLPSTSALEKISNSAEAVFGIHIFHFNPPLEISKEFERKYLKIRQIAFTNPLNS